MYEQAIIVFVFLFFLQTHETISIWRWQREGNRWEIQRKTELYFEDESRKKNAEGLPVSHRLKLPIWGEVKKTITNKYDFGQRLHDCQHILLYLLRTQRVPYIINRLCRTMSGRYLVNINTVFLDRFKFCTL